MRLDKVVHTLSSVMIMIMRAAAANEDQGLQAVCKKLAGMELKQEGMGKSLVKMVRMILEPPSGDVSVLDDPGDYTKMLRQSSAESQMIFVGRAVSRIGAGLKMNEVELADFKQLKKVQQHIQDNFVDRSEIASDIAGADQLYDQFGTLLTKVLMADS